MEAAPLLHAGVRLATDNEILRFEIEGLREGIIMEKKKRQRAKALGLYDEGGSPSQPLFFSPAKVTRARQRAIEMEQAEHQRKQAAEEKKVQLAIAREEKAREAEERKAQRNAARNEVREQRAREKAERAVERATKQAKKLEEAAKRREEAIAKKAAAKEAKEKAAAAAKTTVKSKKRSFVGDELEVPRKMPCAKPSRCRSNQDTDNLTIGSVPQAIELEDSALSTRIIAQPVMCMRNARQVLVSRPSRSGRNIKLPARFQ